jgi:hypothetical protein
VCDQCGASFNASTISSPGPPTDSSDVFRIWCSPTQFSSACSTSIADEAADDDVDVDDDDDEKDLSTTPHAAIRNASLLGSLRQRRQKDVGGVVSLKDFIAAVDRTSESKSKTSGNGVTEMGGLMPTMTTTTRRAVRYSWCAGMAGLNGDALGTSDLRNDFLIECKKNRISLSLSSIHRHRGSLKWNEFSHPG